MGDHEPRPTTFHSLWGGRVEVRCYGRETGNWAFRGDTPAAAEAANQGILAKLSRAVEKGVVVLAPRAMQFNAAIVRPDALKDGWRPWLRRGAVADGTVLDRTGLAFAIASGDCPTLVLCDLRSGLVVATHAGRDCLFDRRAWLDGAPPRRDASVVDAAMRVLREHGAEADDIRAFIACGIGPSMFFHRSGGRGVQEAKNARMTTYFTRMWGPSCIMGRPAEGRLALTEIIRGQLADHGVHPAHVAFDGTDTYGDTGRWGTPLWHSHRRDADGRRNLVLVVRR